MIAQCDNCGMPTTIQFKTQEHPKGITETYFTCQQCSKRYTCFVTNKAVRKKQKEIRRLSGVANTKIRERLQEKVNQRMAELKAELINNGE